MNKMQYLYMNKEIFFVLAPFFKKHLGEKLTKKVEIDQKSIKNAGNYFKICEKKSLKIIDSYLNMKKFDENHKKLTIFVNFLLNF